MPELFNLGRERAPFLAQSLNGFPGNILPAFSQRGADGIQIVAKIFRVVHGVPFKCVRNLASESWRVNETGGEAEDDFS